MTRQEQIELFLHLVAQGIHKDLSVGTKITLVNDLTEDVVREVERRTDYWTCPKDRRPEAH